MSDLRDLYQEVILDHAKNPRNFGAAEDATRRVLGHNPLCGDRYAISVSVQDGRVVDVAFEGEGCAISKASASLMTQALKGKPVEEAERLYERFHRLVTGRPEEADERAVEGADLGKLAVFAGVCDYPARVKCASLAWHALHAALEGSDETVTTE